MLLRFLEGQSTGNGSLALVAPEIEADNLIGAHDAYLTPQLRSIQNMPASSSFQWCRMQRTRCSRVQCSGIIESQEWQE